MRTTFVNELINLAEHDRRIILLTADMGFGVFEHFKQKFPDRYYNLGIAEQNMIGVAAGLAMRGKKVYVYSIIPFLLMRSFEQIRVDICYHTLDVKLIGVGGGLAYGPAGATHHSIEDIAIMRSLPNMEVIAPGDPWEAKYSVIRSYEHNKPTYIRLSKNGEYAVHCQLQKESFIIGKAICLKNEGQKIAILSTGNMLEQSLSLSLELKKQGLPNSLFSFHTIKPIDNELLKQLFEKYEYIISLEEHNIYCGFYSAIMEEFGLQNIGAYKVKKFFPFAIHDEFCHHIGDQNSIRQHYHLDNDAIVVKIKKYIRAI